jgi:putative endopeptidase
MMNAHVVNASSLPAMNALTFPAAILQPSNFDPDRPTVMDYGAFGATVGHEISHCFDDQDALFDATGKLSNWWTKEDLAQFQAAAAKLVKQYDGYRPFPDLTMNGKLTLSENIADLAGLAVAYEQRRYHRMDVVDRALRDRPTSTWTLGQRPDDLAFGRLRERL